MTDKVQFLIGDRMLAWLCECGAAALSFEPFKCPGCGKPPVPAKECGVYTVTKVGGATAPFVLTRNDDE